MEVYETSTSTVKWQPGTDVRCNATGKHRRVTRCGLAFLKTNVNSKLLVMIYMIKNLR